MKIDCHCHLTDPEFEKDLEDVIKQAKEAEVKACICVTEFHHQFEKSLNLGRSYSNYVFPCLGIHPVQFDEEMSTARSALLKDVDKEILARMRQHQTELIAIGEIGLDFTPRYHTSLQEKGINSHEEQRGVLAQQLTLAKELDLPVNVHSRSAGRPTIEMLKEYEISKVVLHAFDGNIKSALPGAQLGYYFSIPPCIARSEQKQKLVLALPLDNLLLETDSPALGAEKNMRNEVRFIDTSVEWIAKLKNISQDEVVRITGENACKLFPKLKTIS